MQHNKMGLFSKHKKKDEEQQCNLQAENKQAQKKVQTVRKPAPSPRRPKQLRSRSCQKNLSFGNLFKTHPELISGHGAKAPSACLASDADTSNKCTKSPGLHPHHHGSVQTKSFKTAIKDYLDEIDPKIKIEAAADLSMKSSRKSSISTEEAGDEQVDGEDILGKFEDYITDKTFPYEKDASKSLEGVGSSPKVASHRTKRSMQSSRARRVTKTKQITKPKSFGKYRNIPVKPKSSRTPNRPTRSDDDLDNLSSCSICHCDDEEEEEDTSEVPQRVSRKISEDLLKKKYKNR